jgi:hypothetical protein
MAVDSLRVAKKYMDWTERPPETYYTSNLTRRRPNNEKT